MSCRLIFCLCIWILMSCGESVNPSTSPKKKDVIINLPLNTVDDPQWYYQFTVSAAEWTPETTQWDAFLKQPQSVLQFISVSSSDVLTVFKLQGMTMHPSEFIDAFTVQTELETETKVQIYNKVETLSAQEERIKWHTRVLLLSFAAETELMLIRMACGPSGCAGFQLSVALKPSQTQLDITVRHELQRVLDWVKHFSQLVPRVSFEE